MKVPEEEAEDYSMIQGMTSGKFTMLYPMYVVRIADFLLMTKAMTHQELLARRLVAKYNESSGTTAVFVSHQWCGRTHADPSFRQLGVLQKVFHRATAGKLTVEIDTLSRIYSRERTSTDKVKLRELGSWVMWFDYFSVPQPLDPRAEADHHTNVEGFLLDYESWKSRGWCRLERLARAFSPTGVKDMLLVKRDDTIFEIGADEWLFEPVGLGAFSVGSDRVRVAETARELVERRLERLKEMSNMTEYRWLIALRTSVFKGLPVDPQKVTASTSGLSPKDDPPTDDAQRFLKLVELPSATSRKQGTSPILLAAYAGDVPALKSFMEQGARVDDKERSEYSAFLVFRGMQPLHLAAWHGHRPALCLLLEKNASVNAPDKSGLRALHCAAFSGEKDAVELLLEHHAEIDARDKIGATPLFAAVARGQREIAEYLISRGATLASTRDGLSALHVASMFGAPADLVRVLAAAGSAACTATIVGA